MAHIPKPQRELLLEGKTRKAEIEIIHPKVVRAICEKLARRERDHAQPVQG